MSKVRIVLGVVLSVLAASCQENIDTHQAARQAKISTRILALKDSIAEAKMAIDSLEGLSSDDLLGIRLEEINNSRYSNLIFNTTQPKAYEEYQSRTLLAEKADVYARALRDSNDTQEPITTLPGYTPITVVGNSRGMYQIRYHDSLEGYIKDFALCEYHIVEPAVNAEFFIWTSKTKPFGKKEVTIAAVGIETGKLIDKITVPFRVHSYRASRRTTALKNAEYVISLNFYRESCPGHEEDCLYAFHNGGFNEVTSSFSMGEYGWYSHNTPMIPVRFENDYIVHLERADIENPIDWKTGEAGHYTVPDSIDIPLDELIVVHSKAAESKVDEHYREIADENGDPVMEVQGEAFHFYQWDGEKLNMVVSTNPGYFAK